MITLCRLAFLLPLLATLSCFASETTRHLNLDQCRGPYRIQPYLEVASALQALPIDDRISTLRAWAGGPDDKYRSYHDYPNEAVITLCRMLFQGKDGQPLRRPRSGAPQFVGEPMGFSPSTDEVMQRHPDEPLRWVGDIPFRVVRGYMIAGVPEPATRYLDYCLAEGEWTTRRFRPATTEELGAALDQMLSHRWEKSLQPHEITFLSEQIEPYTEPALEFTAIGTRLEGTHRSSDISSFSKRSLSVRENEKIELGVHGGSPPYRLTITLLHPEIPAAENTRSVSGRPNLTDPFLSEFLPLDFEHPKPGTRIRIEAHDQTDHSVVQHLITESLRTYRVLTTH